MELELELEGGNGTKLEFGSASSKAVFGRATLGYNTQDRTVSREHLLFELHQTKPKVSFLVIGRNPVWVRSGKEIKVFRRFQKGEVSIGDCFCVASQSPVWFRLKRVAVPGLREDDDVSGIDPVKEFGFLVIGREFDGYRKGRIKKANDWDWFLEEKCRVSEDEGENGENFREKSGGRLGKRKKVSGGGDDYEDEDWGEEDEGIRKVDRGKEYATRSKDGRGVGKERKVKGGSGKREVVGYNEQEAEEDETLGGFIVGDEEEEEERVDEEEDEEEEEFVDDDEEEEDE